ARTDRLDQFRGQLRAAHFRLQVVGGDLGAGDEDALLAVEHILAAAAEEEGDVRVLFRLRDAQLAQARGGGDFAQGVAQVVGREGDRGRQLRVVLGQADTGRQD